MPLIFKEFFLFAGEKNAARMASAVDEFVVVCGLWTVMDEVGRKSAIPDNMLCFRRHLFEPFLRLAALVRLGLGEPTVIDRRIVS